MDNAIVLGGRGRGEGEGGRGGGGGKQDKHGLVKMVYSGPRRASRARELHENNSINNQMQPQCNSTLLSLWVCFGGKSHSQPDF